MAIFASNQYRVNRSSKVIQMAGAEPTQLSFFYRKGIMEGNQ